MTLWCIAPGTVFEKSCGDLQRLFLAKSKITDSQSTKSMPSCRLGVPLWLPCPGQAVSIASARATFSMWIKPPKESIEHEHWGLFAQD